ncbi:penicillin-binding protein [Mangrovivirga sp. M17]|uniref:Penicillin-binding protein n=1 Tax=Mangrovivirga halotolerans TaxID=2993936 RepID=A0ABT3RLS3_9BACT|nr:penicillin-binding protein [Mangrovivirga halotolerans]MCX2742654.1 penicillin-binding protein [Mangrovivirga halotolerans]
MNIKRSIVLRVRIAFIIMFVFALAIIYKIIEIKYIEGEKWVEMAESIGFRDKEVNAVRGNIYSDDGSLLATSLPFYRVAFDATVCDDEVFKSGIDSLSMMLAAHFGDRNKASYERLIKQARAKGDRYIVLGKRYINYREKKELESWPIFRKGQMKGGVIFEKENRRYKPFRQLAARTVGFTNSEKKGVVGLEFSFNNNLAGQNGRAVFQKVGNGNLKQIYDGNEVKAIDGFDIQTTIDINLQDVAESSLRKHLRKHDANYGCVVVMEVATGEIKAIANLSKNAEGEYRERYNYAVASSVEPGSTFKIASAIALMEETGLELSDTIYTGKGEFKFYDRTMRDHKPGGYGTVTLKEAIEKSSNIAVSRWVDQSFNTKPQRFMEYVRSFGLSEPLNFQMVGEGKPYFKDPNASDWYGTTLPWMSIGYELRMSPLHMLTFYNAIANEGKMVAPIIVKSIRKADDVIEHYDTRVIRDQIAGKSTLLKIRKALEGVVERGTAMNIKGTDYNIAGKTGTAQKVKDGRYTKNYYTSFAGYFPAKNPKYSCIVVIDSPKGYFQYGSDVAAPVFKEIADKIFSLDLNLHQPLPSKFAVEKGIFPVVQSGKYDDLNLILNKLGISNHLSEPAEWVKASIDGTSIKWNEKSQSEGLMPDLRGMTGRDALFLLENKGVRVELAGKGRVAKQSQLPGSKLIRGSYVTLTLE